MANELKHIFLYGPPGSGKSTVGKALAKDLAMPLIDLDALIVDRAGMSIAEIMQTQGEEAFREMETRELHSVVSKAPAVISLGGGALLRPDNRTCAEAAGKVVILDAELPVLVERLMAGGDVRPLLAGDLEARLQGLMEARKEHYNSFALRVANYNQGAGETATDIERILGWFHLRQGRQDYDYVIEPGGLSSIGEWVKAHKFTGLIGIVTDSNVGPLYATQVQEFIQQAELEAKVITIPAGETHKTLETVSSLWRSFLKLGLDRKSLVLALGGGVVGDLTGFASSTFMRGIAWAGLPTSLLAMVDSSLGGKTGFDLPYGKNLVGSFHPPSRVLADPQVLSTLPVEEFRSGMGEVMKHGVIADPNLFQMGAKGLENCWEHQDELVRRAVAVKVKHIQVDPYEEIGLRAALNYGHTVGHAVELVSGFHLRHGEAVAIGMVVEARLAERIGLAEKDLADEISVALQTLGLPIRIPVEFSREDLLETIRVDKKKHAGKVRFALPVRIGEVKTGIEIDDLNLIFEEG